MQSQREMPKFAPDGKNVIPAYLLEKTQIDQWLETQPSEIKSWVQANGFSGAIGETLALPNFQDPKGGITAALIGYGTDAERCRGRFHSAASLNALPKATYRLVTDRPSEEIANEALGWLLSSYRYDRYKSRPPLGTELVAPNGVNARRLEQLAQAEFLTRDLINTPARDMGPSELEAETQRLAQAFGADLNIIRGDELIAENFPLIAAVGAAAHDEPRLLDLRHGDTGPRLTVVGKGVCFDTGGLNLKPASSMGLMKKDMGGAANVLGLAQMLMQSGLSIRLRVLIPAVENSVSSTAMRPQDIITARGGQTIEINNTDAEGRLVLADALSYASEEDPDLIVSMATLTGAARVALGPDLAPFFCDHDQRAELVSQAAQRVADPLWRMPFYAPYEPMIEPLIADLDNAPKGGFAGAITAALFLRRFVADPARYIHFDVYGWQPKAAPARPVGGIGQGARALYEAITKGELLESKE